jgi:hypothetical protein
MFTKFGDESLNDYFISISHNKIDLQGTKVFDWKQLEISKIDFNKKYTESATKLDYLRQGD